MKKYFFFSFLFLFVATTYAGVTLPKIFTSNMVLQREKPVKIWGWAGNGEKITVQLNGQKAVTKADKNGNWLVTLQPMQAGGPYELKIDGKSNIVLSNVLIGDVYLQRPVKYGMGIKKHQQCGQRNCCQFLSQYQVVYG
jgi:sialate O-acetylesterase